MTETRIIANDTLLRRVSALLAAGRRVKFCPSGDSMRPFIYGSRDSVVLAPHAALRRGDIVLARTTAGNFVLHRIVDISETGVVLAGDGNLFARERCRLDDVAGIAVSVVRNGCEHSLISFGARALAFAWQVYKGLRRCINKFIRKI